MTEPSLNCERKECVHCGAIWLNGKHYWHTGATDKNSDLTLANLVCNTKYGSPQHCINPKQGQTGGDTWTDRLNDLNPMMDSMKEELRKLDQ